MIQERKEVSTDKAPAAIGPYSQAIRFGKLLFISGQIPLDAQSGDLVGQTASEQTQQVMKNLLAVLEKERLSFKDLVKTTVYLQNLEDFSAFNMVYEEFLSSPDFPPESVWKWQSFHGTYSWRYLL